MGLSFDELSLLRLVDLILLTEAYVGDATEAEEGVRTATQDDIDNLLS
jgi:hypothetical protein